MLDNVQGLSSLLNSIGAIQANQGTQGIQNLNNLSSMLSDSDVQLDGQAFKDIMDELLSSEQVNGISTDELMSGDINNLVTAMTDMAESDLTLQFTMQVRNKIIDAYKEIMSMQI